MMVVPMLQHEAQCLISPLALHKAPTDYPLEFKRSFDQEVVQALFKISGDPLEDVADASAFRLVAGLEVLTMEERIESPRGTTRGYRRWLQLRGDYVSIWVCHTLPNGEATYWYRSHLRLTTIEFSKLRERSSLGGAVAVEDCIAAEMQISLWEQVDTITAFVRLMLRSGTRERILS